MITIDGSQGEGGGQVLRSSLALSMVTGTPFRIEKIRAGRAKPGLLRQHLTAVTAAARVSNAEVIGAALGSGELEFRPQGINAGDYHFAIGSAGSTTLVLQAILPALIVADEQSTVRLEGGTHNPFAPPLDFLARSFLPVLERMGPRVSVSLERAGFFPAGGGRVGMRIEPGRSRLRLDRARRSPDGTSDRPADAEDRRPSKPPAPPLATASLRLADAGLSSIDLNERGEIRERVCRAVVAGLSREIAERELNVIRQGLNWPPDCLRVEELDPKCGPGNILMIELACEHITAVFTGFGMRGVTSEAVAADALEQAKRYLAAGVPVCSCLADQLLLPMAMAGGGSFTTLPLTSHSTTNIDIIRRFLPVSVEVTREDAHRCRVRIARL